MSQDQTLGSIGGVFEPFKKYVKDQLDVRKIILANARLDDDMTEGDEYLDFQLNSRFGLNGESFYAYTVEKQAFIRMMSGVDLKTRKNTLASDLSLNAYEKGIYLKNPESLAQYWVLEGGTRNADATIRGGYEDTKKQNATYGDPSIRADSDGDYGEVPMPGIIDAEIRTKGNNGELREARINFICYNKRQLDMLETLYMRPGHYVAIEWGWDPYIDNNSTRQDNSFSIAGPFLNPSGMGIDDLNRSIRQIKEYTGGNYDGFIGAVKNYTFKAREDGGYDCTTELMAAGELLESLTGHKKTYETNNKLPNSNQYEIEVKDSLYYYFRSLKHSLDRESDSLMIRVNDTQREQMQDVNNVPVSLIAGNTSNQELRQQIADHYQSMIDANEMPSDSDIVDQILKAQYIGGQCPEMGQNGRGPWVEFVEYINPGFFTCMYTDGQSINVIAYNNQGGAVTPMNRNNTKYYSSGQGGVGGQIDYGLGGRRRGEYTVISTPYNNNYYDKGGRAYDIGEARREHLIRYPENEWKFGEGSQDGVSKILGWNNWFWDNVIPTDWNPYVPDHNTDYDYMDHFKGCRIVTDGLESYYRWDKTNGANKLNTQYPLAVIKNGKPGLEYTYLPRDQKNGVYSHGEYDDKNPGYAHYKDEKLYAKVQQAEEIIHDIIVSKIGEAAQKELIQSQHYTAGVMDIIALYKWINKITDVLPEEGESSITKADGTVYETPFGFDPTIGEGLEAMLGGTIVKQVSKYKETYYQEDEGGQLGALKDSGYRKNIFVRWDLICQMLNHLTTYKHDKYDSISEFLQINGGLKSPHMEFTYMTPNQDVWTNRHPSKGLTTKYQGDKFYLRYSVPKILDSDPISSINFWGHVDDSFEGTIDHQLSGYNTMNRSDLSGTDYANTTTGIFHHHIGSSFNSQICLMPHMPIFFNMHVQGMVKYDPEFEDSQEGDANRSRTEEEDAHTFGLCSYKLKRNDQQKQARNSVGLIYFNLDYLLKTYEDMRFTRKSSDNYNNLMTLNRGFNILEFVKEIWKGVNDSCAGHYNFRLVTEHERPNKCRIIDLHVSGAPKKNELYKFEPHGLRSVTRQFFYDSKISADMASAISIAAQAPKDANSLDALSFKSFNKNITSRFAIGEDEDTEKEREMMREDLENDIKSFIRKTDSLNFYLYKLNMGHWVITSGEATLDVPLINTTGAIALAQDIAESRASILNRYPLEHPRAGYWREGTTQQVSPIIPLQFSYKMDGMAGMEPLRLFKIDAKRLPMAYNRDDVAFIIKSEQHKITNTQDWTVDVTGQLVLLDTNPNNGDGRNTRQGESSRDDWKIKQLTKPEQPNADLIRSIDQHSDGNYFSIKKNTGKEFQRDWGMATDELTSNRRGLDITEGSAVGFCLFYYFMTAQDDKLTNSKVDGLKTMWNLGVDGAGDTNFKSYFDLYSMSHRFLVPLSSEKITFVVTSGRDLMHEGLNSKHNQGEALDIVIYWGNAPGGKRRIWNGDWDSSKIAPGTESSFADVDLGILEGLDQVFDKLVEMGVLTSYKNEYTDPSGPATAPHYHLRFHDVTFTRDYLIVNSQGANW